MEDLLQQIIAECGNNKLTSIKASAQTAYDFLLSQNTLLKDPAHELRAKCYFVFQNALETRKNKFISFALSGFHKILRDDRFQTNFEPEDDSLWLPSQFLHAVSSIMSQSDDTQVDILKVLLNIACSTYWTVNGRIIIQMLTVCADVYENGTEAVKTASQAAANQTLRSFCHLLDVESQEAKDDKMHEVGSGGIACFNELIPILQYICSKLDEAQIGQNVASSLLLLEGLHTVLSSLPQRIHTNSHFTKFLWQKLCPALIGLMGVTSRGTNSSFSKFQSNDALYSQNKIIYSVAGQLVRLVGCVGSLRPVLESLYHRMLLFPKPAQRLDPIKALAELLRSPSRLVDLAGPLLVEDERSGQQSDMALTRLIMDSLEECSESKDVNLILSSVTCVEILLDTLLKISNGQSLNSDYVTKINQLYPTLTHCDYKGPLTYQTLFRLPQTYRDTVGVSESQPDKPTPTQDGDVSSQSDGVVSDSSNDTSEGEEEGLAPPTLGFHESLGSIQNEKVYSKEKGDCERDNARYYFETLLEFLPSLLPLKYSIEVDDALQKFASKYCQGLYYKESNNSELETAIVNADGIYLATYSALFLNLKLINVGFYENDSDEIPLTEEQFVREVEESGVLVYLSSRWLCELYQQVLCVNLLKTSGCDSNLAVVNLLSDLGGIHFETEVLSNCAKLEKASLKQISTAEIQAGQKLARRLLTCCWDSLLAVLAEGVKGDQETVPHSLQALHTAALLCNVTGLQKKSGMVFSLLSNACCIESEDKPSLMVSHVLSLDVLLSRSLELASHAPHSWPHVLKCAMYVTNLEHAFTYSFPVKLTRLSATDNQENIIPSSSENDIACIVGDLPGTAVLNTQAAANAVCILSQHIDRLFENAATKLKLNSLLGFCSAVCCASDKQLSSGLLTKNGKKLNNLMWLIKGNKAVPPPPLLLSRLSQLVIKAARSGRPLIHIMKLWSAVGPHLMHAACHKDAIVSKLAVSCIHDIMTTLLNENVELEHFHFNEALFKPFENLLCLELCDSDIQDQVVNCISEFVEGSQAEIKSGWRPLFRALGGVATSNHINSLVEVFQVFLNTSNPSVLANAAMDFIQCLTKHVRGNGVSEQTDNDSECRAILDYVEKCSQMLCLMHTMTSCPRFNTARRLEERISDESFPVLPDPEGALAVWAELVEGLASVVLLSPKIYQPLILDLLFSMLTDMYEKPGIDFNLYCISYIIIASIQRWTIYNSHDLNLWDLQASSFRQYCGMTTHFVIKLLIRLRERQEEDRKGSLMLQKMVSVMTECATVPVESVARLGCACLRHIVVTGSDILTPDQWSDVISGITQAASSVLTPLTTLNAAYSHNCHQYYGDLFHIKVAARKDSSVERNSRLQHLAQQVLLLENQRKAFSPSENEQSVDERSYVLLIYDSPDSSATKDCVPLGNLLVSLLSHQMLLQTIGTVLLQGTEHEIPSLAGVVQNNNKDVRILKKLHDDAVEMLLSCLELSYNTAVEFDSRPGLKFLIQKVAGLDRAANLYRQAGAAWTINLISLFDLCLCNSSDYMKDFLPKLRLSLEQLCDTYVEVLLDKDGIHSAVDCIEEKITFIIAQTDDLPGLSRSSSEKSDEDLKSNEGGRTDAAEEIAKTATESLSLETPVDKRDLGAEIERQKEESICKDREAHMGVWAEILVSALELLCQLDDCSLRTLLPAVFPTVRTLTAHASHSSLRHQLAALFDRVALIYGFSNQSPSKGTNL